MSHGAPGTRRAVLAAIACTAAWGAGAPAAADTVRPLRLIVPQAPGGAADFSARLIAQDLSSRLGRTVVVDNRPGAGMIIGTQAVAMAPPDGNTVGMVFSAHAINQAMRHRMPYDALTDFAPVCLGGHSVVGLVAHPDFAARSVAELIELARHTDPPLQYASLGIGSVSHLAGELLALEAQVALAHVPYSDSAHIYAALTRRDVPLAFVTLESALPHLRAQRLRALAVTSAGRVAPFEHLPTISESLPGYELIGFYGFVAPARTPKPLVETLSLEITRTLLTPRIRNRLGDGGLVVSVAAPAAFADFLRRQVDLYARLAQRTGIALDT